MTDYFELGRILKPQGIKGEIKLDAFTDDFSRFSYLSHVFFLTDGVYEQVTVESARTDGHFAYLKLAGYEDRNAVEALRGQMVWIDRANAAKLPEGAYYIRDLIGLAVAGNDGLLLGTLLDILQNGATDVYVVKTAERGNCMFPAIPQVVLEKNLEKGVIIVDTEKLSEVAVYDI